MTNYHDALQCYEPGTMAVKQLFDDKPKIG
jgi:hypothetical protein